MSPCRQNLDVIVAWSLIGGPFLRRKPAFMCVVSVTSVSPSQRPVVKPPRVCSAYFDGCGRPSIQMVIGARSSHAPIVQEMTEPLIGSVSAQIFNPNGPCTKYTAGQPSHWRSTIASCPSL